MSRASNALAALLLFVAAIALIVAAGDRSAFETPEAAGPQERARVLSERTSTDRSSDGPQASPRHAERAEPDASVTSNTSNTSDTRQDYQAELEPGEHEASPGSLDEATAHEIEARLSRAIERAQRERGVFIASRLVEQVIERGEVRVIVAQREARETLPAQLAGSRHGEPHYFHNIPYAALSVGPQALLALVESGEVTAIEEDSLNYPSLSSTLPIIGADLAVEAGFDGGDWVIAVLDTGVQLDHPFFADRVLDGACFSSQSDCPNGERTMLGIAAGASCDFSCSHGSYVAGVALGYDADQPLAGVAPAASLISIQIFSEVEPDDPAAHTSDIIAGLEHVYDLRFSYDIAAVNLSLGGDPYASQAECNAANGARKAIIDRLRSAGIATVVSSGNDGFTDLIAAPACISSAISVGATDDRDVPAPFSNSASYLDLLAPGRFVRTSTTGSNFTLVSGTSIAAPHVSGSIAAILTASPTSSVSDILHAFEQTGTPVTDERNEVTTPRINTMDAIDFLLGGGGSGEPEEPTTDDPESPTDPSSDCGLVGLELLLPLMLARAGLRRRRAH